MYSHLMSKESLYKYIKYQSEEPNIEIYTDRGVYNVNFYDKELKEKVYQIFDDCQLNEELILGVKWYS